MSRSVLFRVWVVLLALPLVSCGFGGPGRERWRGEEEASCFANGDIQLSPYVQERREIDGAGACGIDRPLTVYALLQGSLAVEPKATLNCAQAAKLDRFMARIVQPAAMRRFGVQAEALLDFGAYGCRTRNNEFGAKLSEHSFGNAIDLAGFRLADGRHLRVKSGWNGDPDESAFWRDVEAGACDMFRTVLGPGSDGYHEDHLHLDLLRHDAQGRRHICDPLPVRLPPGQFTPGRPAPQVAQGSIRQDGQVRPLVAAGVYGSPLYGNAANNGSFSGNRLQQVANRETLSPFDPSRIDRLAQQPQLPMAVPAAPQGIAPTYTQPDLSGGLVFGGLY